MLGGENRLREQYRRKDTVKTAQMLDFCWTLINPSG